MFKLWSQTSEEATKELKPDLGFREWGVLSFDEKYRIWKYLEKYFFKKITHEFFGEGEHEYKRNGDKILKEERILTVIHSLNQQYKHKSYGRKYLEDRMFTSACDDFYRIFSDESENVVFQLLSMYAKMIILERAEKNLEKGKGESDEDFQKRNNEWRLKKFDEFTKDLNDVFEQFGVYVFLSRQGFAPRQSKKITQDIYVPVLEFLSSEEYKEVNLMLEKSFASFQEKHYDKVISNSINAVHAYLQLKIHNKIGKSNLKTLLVEAQKEKIIPSGKLSTELYGNIESFLARTRQEKTDSHPSTEKATENDALFVLNLTMVILQSFVKFQK